MCCCTAGEWDDAWQQGMASVKEQHPREPFLLLRLYSDLHQVYRYAIFRNKPNKPLHKIDKRTTAVYSFSADHSLVDQLPLKDYLPRVFSVKEEKKWKTHCDVMAVSGEWLDPYVPMPQWCKQQQQQE